MGLAGTVKGIPRSLQVTQAIPGLLQFPHTPRSAPHSSVVRVEIQWFPLSHKVGVEPLAALPAPTLTPDQATPHPYDTHTH